MYCRGSEWRRWDLHVHTPCSILNNQFGSDFDAYVVSLFTKAIEHEIAVIGITDYFSIEGYKKIKLDYLGNREKMMELFPDEETRNRIANILLLPNIELRLDTFIGEGSRSANYHVIFSDTVTIGEIENKFLSKLAIPLSVNGGTPRYVNANMLGIVELGQHIKQVQGISGSDYEVGLKNATVHLDNIIEILNCEMCFNDKYLLGFPSDEDWSSVQWDSRDGNTRRKMVQSAHILFTSNPKSVAWALGEFNDTPSAYIEEFYRFRPCMSACDAHSIDELFCNYEDRYCWIKSNPTFNGLKQTLYEPKDRVRISATIPESKPDYQVIRSVKISDELFSAEPIEFNDKLVCIIGGKSTGKSLLLHNIAYCIDKNQVEKKCSITNTKVKPVKGIEVTWGDGHTSSSANSGSTDKIIYVPQTYLNRLSDEKEESTEVDKMVQDTLLQDSEIDTMYTQHDIECTALKKEVDKQIYELLDLHKQLGTTSDKRSELGSSSGIKKEIDKLTKQKTELLQELDVSAEIITEYNSLQNNIAAVTEAITDLEKDKLFIDNDFEISLDVSEYTALRTISYERIEQTISSISEDIRKQVDTLKQALTTELNDTLLQKRNLLETYTLRIDEIKPIVIKSQGVSEIEERVQVETEKLQKVVLLEKQETELLSKIDKELDAIANSINQYLSLYNQYVDFVNEHNASSIDDMEFRLETVFRRDRFEAYLKKIIDNRTIPRFSDFALKTFEAGQYSAENIKKVAFSIMQGNASSLELKADVTLESALRELFGDWFNINYIVKMEDDLIHDMSPGKKALVLLKLLIGMAQSNTPILIDQPEDDLDNRSIFDDLVKYIKRRKIDRQIIVVTHNANIVVGGDSEQVIIANQHGKNAPNHTFKFEYRSGAIEDDNAVYVDGNIKDGVLNTQGIQSHICEILEGGTKAFELRKNKYFIVS